LNEELQEDKKWIVPIEDSPKPPPRRVTITLPVINHALNVAFIVTGDNKATVIKVSRVLLLFSVLSMLSDRISVNFERRIN
jgi:hypothetical protein